MTETTQNSPVNVPVETPGAIKRSRRANWYELGMCILLLGAFVLAVFETDSPLMTLFVKIKWFIYLGVIYLTFLTNLILRRFVRFNMTSVCFLSFVVFATVSSALSKQDLSDGLHRSFSFFCLFLLAFVFAWPADPARRLDLWTYATLLICGSIVYVSVAYAFIGGSFVGSRMSGVMQNPNSFGSLAAMMTAGCFGLLHKDQGRGAFLLKASIALGLLCVLLTQSRASLMAAVAGILSICILRRKWPLTILIVSVGCVIFAPTEYLSWRKLGSLGKREVTIRSLTIDSRAKLWHEQIASWQEKPLLGHGLQITGRGGAGRIGGESSYLDILGTTGILGTVPIFLGFLFGLITLYRLGKCSESDKDGHSFSLYHTPALGMVVVVLVNSFSEGFMAAVGAMQPIYVWVVLAAASQVARCRKQMFCND